MFCCLSFPGDCHKEKGVVLGTIGLILLALIVLRRWHAMTDTVRSLLSALLLCATALALQLASAKGWALQVLELAA